MGDFEADKKLGDYGKHHFLNHLQEILPGWKVITTQEPYGLGVDFVADDGGQQRKIKVTFERRHTGNLFLETLNNVTGRKPGWFSETEADVLVAGFEDQMTWYVLDVNAARDYVRGHSALKRTRSETTQGRNVLYQSEGVLLPVDQGTRERLITAKRQIGILRERLNVMTCAQGFRRHRLVAPSCR